MTSVVILAGSVLRSGWNLCIIVIVSRRLLCSRENKLNKLIKRRQGSKISRRIIVTRGPSRSKNQFMFHNIFDGGPGSVSAWVTLSKGMEHLAWLYTFF